MKVAFDVQGTLLNYDGPNVATIALFKRLQEMGHDCYIWSFGGFGMARDAANECGLKPKACMSKRNAQYDYDDDGKRVRLEPEFDVCIDDDGVSAATLDAGRVISVYDIPDPTDTETFESFIKDNFTKA